MMELLKEEKERMERLRAKRAEASTPGHTCSVQEDIGSNTSSKRDLYKVALLLREANKINQYLNTNLVSSLGMDCI